MTVNIFFDKNNRARIPNQKVEIVGETDDVVLGLWLGRYVAAFPADTSEWWVLSALWTR